MDESSTVEWLSRAIGQATRSAKFCVSGCLPVVDPGIVVVGSATLRLPLKPKATKELVAACQLAPYGKGTQTLVNESVRNTFELDPKKFRLSDAWTEAVSGLLPPVAEQLGLPAETLEARLYKLLVYEKGGFFLPHRDSEKHDRMVATMIVVLPNPFEGGALVVRHGAAEERLKFAEAAGGKLPCYAAFYADCEHEVERVTRGVRLCLAYNLVLKPDHVKPTADTDPAATDDLLAGAIGSWVARWPAKPLVFALEHHYTEAGLSPDLLKGADRQIADLVIAAAEKTGCVVHLSQVSRHLSQFADDGSFERGYSRYGRTSRGRLEIGETYEDELSGTEWTDLGGKKQPWGDIPFEPTDIVSSVPIDDWKPSREEYEGYTGNAGNTLDRWYHRSAVVVWHRDHHFDVVASSGVTGCIPLFRSLTAKLGKTPKKRLDDARTECIRFARGIVGAWPRRGGGYYAHAEAKVDDPYAEFLDPLLALRDRDTVAMFLTRLAEQDESLRLNSFLLAACREFGWNAFAREMTLLLSPKSEERGREELLFRDVEWLSAFCCDKTADPDKSALGEELCRLAARRFCQPRPAYGWSRGFAEPSVSEKSLPFLLKALLASGRDEDLTRVITFVRGSPAAFGVERCQVPCLKTLIPWSRKRTGSVHPGLASWLASVREGLEAATGSRPKPPSDWARPAVVACKCANCARVNAFLADPANKVGRFPAPEDQRRHLTSLLEQHQCDVKSDLDRTGRPYSLVLTKTFGSYERAVKRFETDLLLLQSLPDAE